MYRTARAIQKSMRSIVGSAASFLCSALIIHTIALRLDPSFSLLLTRGVGKVALMWAALLHIIWFLAIQSDSFATPLWHSAITWPLQKRSWPPFFRFFLLFCGAHILFISSYYITGWATWHPEALPLLLTRWPVLLVGCIGTFFLAWSEELIFRGLLFSHFRRTLSIFTSAVTSSFIFSILHDLHNPLNLVTHNWQLGLGLFLLGMFLTYVRVWKKSLAASAGVHAGLVFIKVVLRKVNVLPIMSGSTYLFPVDLRESLIVHLLLTVGCIMIAQHITATEKKAS